MNDLRSFYQLLLAFGVGAVSLFLPPNTFGESSPIGEASFLSPRFSIKQQDQMFWLVRPNGERFFSFGVCCVNQGTSRAEWDLANPSYAAWQHYHDTNAWAVSALHRLKTWGFTT